MGEVFAIRLLCAEMEAASRAKRSNKGAATLLRCDHTVGGTREHQCGHSPTGGLDEHIRAITGREPACVVH